MTSMEWVKVDRDELNQNPREEFIAGVKLDVYFSPDDLPIRVGGGYDDSRDRFVVRFAYSGESEPTTELRESNHLRFRLGKTSHRLYEVEIDLESLGAQTVEVNIEEVDRAIDDFVKQRDLKEKMLLPIDNFVAAKTALHQRRHELIDALSKLESA